MRPKIKYKTLNGKLKKPAPKARFHPYEEHEEIIVPEDRHKLHPAVLKEAQEYFRENRHCMICVKPFDGTRRHAIDHCHVTGVIRGKLCTACNMGLGMFKDDIYIMRSALSYLENFKYRADMVDQDLWSDD